MAQQQQNGGQISASNFLLMQEKIETSKGENKILRQKLQSKSEALVILSQELDKVRNECEDYRELTRRLQTQWSLLSSDLGGPSHVSLFNSSNQKISELREENKRLVTEREHLRKVLSDREEDVKLIRQQWIKEKENSNIAPEGKQEIHSANGYSTTEMVRRLEILQIKYDCLKRDLQSLLDEKVDLVQERDAYKCKVHRLNHSMAALLKSDGYKSLDVDCLLSENRFLKESLEHAKEEKDLANEMGKRYKKALEKSKSSHLPAAPDAQKVEAEIGEIRSLMQQTSFPCPPDVDLNHPQSLRELATSLLETLNERMTQLKHQRRANKHLMERIGEIEAKIVAEHQDPDRVLWPSQYLMKNYHPLSADLETAALPQDIMLDVTSPDLSDLQKRFEQQFPAAPDILMNTTSSYNNVEDANAAMNVELPAHLQKLVDRALQDFNEQQKDT